MLYALVQVRSASAALNLRDYQAFSRVFTGSTGTFSDPTRLTRWTRGFLCAHVAIVVIRLSIPVPSRESGGLLNSHRSSGACGGGGSRLSPHLRRVCVSSREGAPPSPKSDARPVVTPPPHGRPDILHVEARESYSDFLIS